uniref:uncharacterized protein LOC129501405 n=1 Tax=Nyctereutes procyonoides TaxID=34880 RepID=UPI002443B3B3|nr:uncharacterized protein LOC129501405 [Nyctereutes procyonoides]
MDQTPGGWEGKVVYLAQETKSNLRKDAMGPALVIHGVVAKKDMAPALENGRKEEISHMLAPLGNLRRNMNLDLNQRVGEGKVIVVCHMDWMLVDTNQTLLSQERVEDKSLDLALEVQETGEAKTMHVVPAIQVGVESHKMLLVLVRKVDLEGKEINIAVPNQVINQEVVEDKIMDVFQEVSPLDIVNMSLDPVASLLVRENMYLEHVVKHRTVEDNREQVQISPVAVNNMGLKQVSLLVMVNMDLVLVDTFQTLIKKDLVQMDFLNVDNMGLALGSPLALDNMGQAQVNPLAVDMALAHVSPLALASMGLAQVNPLVYVNMGLAQDSPLALDNMGLAQVNHLAVDMALAHVSPLALASMGLAQFNPLALDNMGLVQVSTLV